MTRAALAASGWVQVAGALAAELVAHLFASAKATVSQAAIDEAADIIARAVGRMPLSIRQGSQSQIAVGLVGAIGDILRLGMERRRELLVAVGVRLTKSSAAELAAEVDKLTKTMEDL